MRMIHRVVKREKPPSKRPCIRSSTNSVVPVTYRIRVHTNSGSKPRFNDSVDTCK